jgi:hypothetical protein
VIKVYFDYLYGLSLKIFISYKSVVADVQSNENVGLHMMSGRIACFSASPLPQSALKFHFVLNKGSLFSFSDSYAIVILAHQTHKNVV